MPEPLPGPSSVRSNPPPLTVTEDQVEQFVQSMREVVELIHGSGSFWADAIGLARRVVTT